jgi:hypothetical protein
MASSDVTVRVAVSPDLEALAKWVRAENAVRQWLYLPHCAARPLEPAPEEMATTP